MCTIDTWMIWIIKLNLVFDLEHYLYLTWSITHLMSGSKGIHCLMLCSFSAANVKYKH